MDIKLKVGQRIKQLRKELELSQEALALKADVDRTYVTDVENGRRNVSLEILEKLITALQVSFKDFFDSKEFKK
ncbi:MAG TPA: helix-turn-helix transcriptional regulator [Ignavibacteriaceae bacterium]